MQLSRLSVIAVLALALGACVDVEEPDLDTVEAEITQTSGGGGHAAVEDMAVAGPGDPVAAGGTTCSITCSTDVNPCDICLSSPAVPNSAPMETSCSANCLWKDVAHCECRNGEAVCGCAW